MIREASTYAIRHLTEKDHTENIYGVHVLTSSTWIRPLKKTDINVWVPQAGPSPELLALWRGAQIDWKTFIERYKAEQQAHTRTRIVNYHSGRKSTESVVPMSPVDYIARLARYQVVTVLCWERAIPEHETQPHCHRFTLAALIEQRLN